ncbi:hypothetical protein JA1_004128 [Spathaspora sp. JA1]|nr:hypothetical protein JA1_004128 [Spathaspora sp. JA1]
MKFLTAILASVALASATDSHLLNIFKRDTSACTGSCIEMQNTVEKCQPGDSNLETQAVLDCICGLGDTFFNQLSDCSTNCDNVSGEVESEYGANNLTPSNLKKIYCNAAAQFSSLVAAGAIPSGYVGGPGNALGVDIGPTGLVIQTEGDEDVGAATDDSYGSEGEGTFEAQAFGSETANALSITASETGSWVIAYTSGGTVIRTFAKATPTKAAAIPNSIETDVNAAENETSSESNSKTTTTSKTTSSTTSQSNTEQTTTATTKSEQTTSKTSSKAETSSETETTAAETKTTNGAQTLGVSLISLLAIALL